jgi:hypothetical protein
MIFWWIVAVSRVQARPGSPIEMPGAIEAARRRLGG